MFVAMTLWTSHPPPLPPSPVDVDSAVTTNDSSRLGGILHQDNRRSNQRSVATAATNATGMSLLLQQPAAAAVESHPSSATPLITKWDPLYYPNYTWDQSPVVIEEYKLVFFTVPKVACTAFNQLFRRMMGYADNWKQHDMYEEPFLPHNPYNNGLSYLWHYSLEQANDMMTSPSWTRAIFVRRPHDRVLSAFLDKAVDSDGAYIRKFCCTTQLRRQHKDVYDMIQCDTGTKNYTSSSTTNGNDDSSTLPLLPIVEFEQFLSHIIPACADPHWTPQSQRMSSQQWQSINFVGYFENLYHDTKTLLSQIGAWETHGAHGWGERDVGNEQQGSADADAIAMFDSNAQISKHGTTTKQQKRQGNSTTTSAYYFTPSTMRLITKLYAEDYNHSVLKFETPTTRDDIK